MCVSLPTGSGKSLCYGVLPVLFDRVLPVLFDRLQRSDRRSIVVVMSPLISLMKDQTNSFSARGLSVVFIGSEQDDRSAMKEVCEGSYQLVYMSPETLLQNIKRNTAFTCV